MRGFTFLLLLMSYGSVLADGIESVRVRTEAERARVVFDLHEQITYRAFTMANPHRVVVDIENIEYPKALSLPGTEHTDGDAFQVLQGLRYAVRHDTGLRIVLDLNDDIALKHTVLPPRQEYGHRLVLDLYRSDQTHRTMPAEKALSKPEQAPSTPKQNKPAPQLPEPENLRVVSSEPPQTAPDDGAKALAILNGHSKNDDSNAIDATSDEQRPNTASREPERLVAAEVKPSETELQSEREDQMADAQMTERVAADQAPRKPPRDVVIAIDAGHGGHDVGAIGPKGTYEKDIVLRIARELAAAVNKQHGMRAILTRNKDEYVGLRDRMHRARDRRADLFVSIHADAFRDRRVRGSSVYVLSQNGASSEAARWLAENENAADLVGGVQLGDKDDVVKSVLLDLSQSASIDASIDAADAVLAALKKIGKVHKPTVQKAGFMVLKSPDIPSLLVETAFISNPTEEKRLRSTQYQRKLAHALTHGIVEYFNENPIPETRFAEQYQRQHKVTRGDTLSEIAERYAVSMESIKLANEMSRDRVRLGEVLTIP